MEQMRPLEITVISGEGLKKVKHLTKMDVYVVVKISGDSSTEQKTPVHKDGGTTPKWNHAMHFTIIETLAQTSSLIITFKLMCCRTFRGDKEIGEAQVSVKELLDSAGYSSSAKYVTYPVKKPSGKSKGQLNFLFRFGEKTPNAAVPAYPVHVMTAMNTMHPLPHYAEAVPAYPPVGFQQPVQEGYKPVPQPPPGYPPMGHGTSYPPVATAAGYPPVGPGYGYPPVVEQPEPKNDGTSDGIALGAAAVLLGGILLGDMVSDAATASYEAGCDPYANSADYI